MTTPTITVPVPPLGGFTLADLTKVVTPKRTQLIRGGLYVNAAPASWHNLLEFELMSVIKRSATGVMVLPQVAVRLAENHAPEPDILVVRRDAYHPDTNAYPPDQVVLAVEIMSGDTRKDRVVRPEEYAQAGIRYYWRVERTAAKKLVAYTFERDEATGEYLPTGVHRGRLALDDPWKIDCDLERLIEP